MADNVTVDNGGLTDYVVASDDDGTAQHQYVKLEWGPDGTMTKANTGSGAIPIQDGGNSITVDASSASPLYVQSSTATPVYIANSSGSVTAAVTVGTAATDLGKAEDAAHSSGDTGVMVLAVRNDTPSALAGTTGDYIPLTTNSGGALYVAAASNLFPTVQATGYLFDAVNNAYATPKWATISTSASGQTSLVAAVSGYKIRVISLSVMSNSAVNVKFQSASTDKTGLYYLAANTGFVLAPNNMGWFETAANEALNINLSGAVAVGGVLQYIEVA